MAQPKHQGDEKLIVRRMELGYLDHSAASVMHIITLLQRDKDDRNMPFGFSRDFDFEVLGLFVQHGDARLFGFENGFLRVLVHRHHCLVGG